MAPEILDVRLPPGHEWTYFPKRMNALTYLEPGSQGEPVVVEVTVSANQFKRKANLAAASN